MSKYMVLVDSSVWIDYFRSGGLQKLDRLIEEDLVCTNELILTELAPALMKRNEREILDGLNAIPKIPLNIDWDIIREYQLLNLNHGINRVGIPDLIILQQVIDQKLSLFTLDKHFALMKKHLNFDMLSA
ncbi:MAG: PIN domain-containing protein [Balneolia bacterium]|nr:PIN domain-containing protein [Balneolia bacterium]